MVGTVHLLFVLNKSVHMNQTKTFNATYERERERERERREREREFKTNFRTIHGVEDILDEPIYQIL